MKNSREQKQAARVDHLLRPEVLDSFDRTVFEREGFWVWEGVLTDKGQKQFTASLQQLQHMNDHILMDTDWAAIDFEGRGLPSPPPEQITPEFLESCCGGSEQMPGFLRGEIRAYMHEHGLLGPDPALVTHGFESLGVMPEYFPAGYDDFIMDVTTAHPQMMELFRKLFGDRFVLDHCLMLNRAAGSRGRRWHAHQYREGQYEVEDPIGTGRALTPEYLQQQCIRTLCYPEGAESGDGAELGIIPGSHLYRIPFKWNTERLDEDADMQANWLKGKDPRFHWQAVRNSTSINTARKHGFICPPHAASRSTPSAGGTDSMGIVNGVSNARSPSLSSQVDKRHPCPLGRTYCGGRKTLRCGAPRIRGG